MTTCSTCGCKLGRTVKTLVDRSLGFTAMLELYPGFRASEDIEGSKIITAFLEDWYGSDHTDMWAYAKEWVATRTAPGSSEARETFCSTCGHLDTPGVHLFAECPRYHEHTWICLVAEHGPDAPYGCQQCPARTTGREIKQ